MKRMKKGMSILLAFILILSVMLHPKIVSSAEKATVKTQEEMKTVSVEEIEGKSSSSTTISNKKDESRKNDDISQSEISTMTTEDGEKSIKFSNENQETTMEMPTQIQETETSEFSTENQEKITAEASTQSQETEVSKFSTEDQEETIAGNSTEDQERVNFSTEDQEKTITGMGGNIANVEDKEDEVQSLLQLKEIKAYLALNNYSEEEIKAMPVTDVLKKLRDKDGNFIEIPDSATVVWTRYKDKNGNIIYDEYHEIDKNETVDLSDFENSTGYTMELIVGSGKQLDSKNIRYIVKVYIGYPEDISFELYSQPIDSERTKLQPERIQFVQSDSPITAEGGNKIRAWNYMSFMGEGAYINPYLGVESKLDEHPDVSVKIYESTDFLKNGWNATEITSQVLDQDMSQKNAGYRMTGALASFLVFYYIDNVQTDAILLNYLISGGVSDIEGDILSESDGKKISIVEDVSYSFTMNQDSSGTYSYILQKGYPADEEYYLTLNAISATKGNVNDKIVKAVVGIYDSLDDAAEQPDIKSELFSENGYRANYSNEGIKFTVFFAEKGVFVSDDKYQFTIKTVGYTDVHRAYFKGPIVGQADPWFRVTGANKEDEILDTYIVENGKHINMDTMYGYGYQTVVINDENVDLLKLKPIFDVDKERVEKISLNGKDFVDSDFKAMDVLEGFLSEEQKEEYEKTDKTKLTVGFTTVIDGHQKNYIVTFAKKTANAKLFVPGPQTHEVFLDEYFEYKHDILVMNLGNVPLEDLNVELIDASHVKLDDYWTVGGENNNTLAAFETTQTNKEYGQLNNMAKIRLLPDGEGGEIKGKLKITAKGQEPVIIDLTGRASNPKITTTKLDDAVKYVPYSYLVSTNNMYDWNQVSFSMTGELPDGLEFTEETGEIYGVPQQEGKFTITVTAEFKSDTYEFEASTQTLTLNVKLNENEEVYNASDIDDGYELLDAIGTDVGGYDFVLDVKEDKGFEDEIFRSNGEFGDFDVEGIGAVYLNGKKLERDVDYKAESGSTKITIFKKTFENEQLVKRDSANTIAAEFRVGGDAKNELKRTAQNFRINIVTPSSSASTENTENTTKNTSTTNTSTTKNTSTTNTSTTKNTSTTNTSTTKNTSTINTSTTKNTSTTNTSTTNSPSSTNTTGSTTNTTRNTIITKNGNGGSNTVNSNNSTSSNTNNTIKVDSNAVTCTIHLVDADNKVLANIPLELRSTPKKMTTNKKGLATFQNIDFGKHTLYAKGSTTASKGFEIISGDTLKLENDKITVPRGTIFTLKVKYDGKKLTLLSIQSGSEDNIKTGDDSNFEFWTFILILSVAGICIITAGVMKNKINKSFELKKHKK